MLRGLRLRLTFLYFGVAVAFTGLMMLGTHRLVAIYLQNSTDLALRYRMAQEFSLLGLPLPTELNQAVTIWNDRRDSPPPTSAPQQVVQLDGEGENETDHESEGEGHTEDGESAYHEWSEEAYDGDLASIYTLPLNTGGDIQQASLSSVSNLPPDSDAVQSAARNGNDLRTIQLQNGTHIRLLTYTVPGGSDNPAFLQLGRPLNDQRRTLNQLVVVMASLGGAMLILLGVGSWWIAGRSISPAESAWHKQQAFIANAGHELRAPLTLIRANTEVTLRKTGEGDPRRETLEDTLEETEHMGSLVSDLLTLSRLDSGALKMDLQTIDVSQLLEDLRRQVSALAAEKGVAVSVPGSEGAVIADRTRLRQVLLILFDNALGYTDSGGQITFSSKVQVDNVHINVRDTGVGIRPEDLEHVFERFYQVERDGRSGSGLGLSIAQSLAEAMDGELDITSSLEKGTTVMLTIPSAH